jgi:hypothetical protein
MFGNIFVLFSNHSFCHLLVEFDLVLEYSVSIKGILLGPIILARIKVKGK